MADAKSTNELEATVGNENGGVQSGHSAFTGEEIVSRSKDIQRDACDQIEALFLGHFCDLTEKNRVIVPNRYVPLTVNQPFYPPGTFPEPNDLNTALLNFDNDDTSGGDGARSLNTGTESLPSMRTGRNHSAPRTGRSASQDVITGVEPDIYTKTPPTHPSMDNLFTGRARTPIRSKPLRSRFGGLIQPEPRPKTDMRTGEARTPNKDDDYESYGPTFLETGKSHTQLRTGRSRSPYRTGRERSPYKTGRSRSPYNTGRERSPYNTAKARSPYNTAQARSPYATGRERSPSLATGRGRFPYNTAKARSPYGTAREHSPSMDTGRPHSSYGTAREHSPSMATGRGRSPYNTAREHSPSMDTGRARSPYDAPKTGLARTPLQTGRGRTPNRTARSRSPYNTAREQPSMCTAHAHSPFCTARSRTPQPNDEDDEEIGKILLLTGRENSAPRTAMERTPLRTGRGRSPSVNTAFDPTDACTAVEPQSPAVSTGRGRTPLNTGRSRSPYNAPEDSSLFKTGREFSPLQTGRSRTPLNTGRSRTPLDTAQARTPLATGRSRTLSDYGIPDQLRTGLAVTPLKTAEPRSPYKTGRARSPYDAPELNTGLARTPLQTGRGRSPYNTARSARSPYKTGRSNTSVRPTTLSNRTGRQATSPAIPTLSEKTAKTPRDLQTGRATTPLRTGRATSPISEIVTGQGESPLNTGAAHTPLHTGQGHTPNRRASSLKPAQLFGSGGRDPTFLEMATSLERSPAQVSSRSYLGGDEPQRYSRPRNFKRTASTTAPDQPSDGVNTALSPGSKTPTAKPQLCEDCLKTARVHSPNDDSVNTAVGSFRGQNGPQLARKHVPETKLKTAKNNSLVNVQELDENCPMCLRPFKLNVETFVTRRKRSVPQGIPAHAPLAQQYVPPGSSAACNAKARPSDVTKSSRSQSRSNKSTLSEEFTEYLEKDPKDGQILVTVLFIEKTANKGFSYRRVQKQLYGELTLRRCVKTLMKEFAPGKRILTHRVLLENGDVLRNGSAERMNLRTLGFDQLQKFAKKEYLPLIFDIAGQYDAKTKKKE